MYSDIATSPGFGRGFFMRMARSPAHGFPMRMGHQKGWRKQSGVDMRIGLDVASLAYERIVDQVVLIAGDSDFLPVAKVARRSGVDFLLDPMGHHVADSLKVQTDGIEDLSKAFRPKKN